MTLTISFTYILQRISNNSQVYVMWIMHSNHQLKLHWIHGAINYNTPVKVALWGLNKRRKFWFWNLVCNFVQIGMFQFQFIINRRTYLPNFVGIWGNSIFIQSLDCSVVRIFTNMIIYDSSTVYLPLKNKNYIYIVGKLTPQKKMTKISHKNKWFTL